MEEKNIRTTETTGQTSVRTNIHWCLKTNVFDVGVCLMLSLWAATAVRENTVPSGLMRGLEFY